MFFLPTFELTVRCLILFQCREPPPVIPGSHTAPAGLPNPAGMWPGFANPGRAALWTWPEFGNLGRAVWWMGNMVNGQATISLIYNKNSLSQNYYDFNTRLINKYQVDTIFE